MQRKKPQPYEPVLTSIELCQVHKGKIASKHLAITYPFNAAGAPILKGENPTSMGH
jgi:hypothetical protein